MGKTIDRWPERALKDQEGEKGESVSPARELPEPAYSERVDTSRGAKRPAPSTDREAPREERDRLRREREEQESSLTHHPPPEETTREHEEDEKVEREMHPINVQEWSEGDPPERIPCSAHWKRGTHDPCARVRIWEERPSEHTPDDWGTEEEREESL